MDKQRIRKEWIKFFDKADMKPINEIASFAKNIVDTLGVDTSPNTTNWMTKQIEKRPNGVKLSKLIFTVGGLQMTCHYFDKWRGYANKKVKTFQGFLEFLIETKTKLPAPVYAYSYNRRANLLLGTCLELKLVKHQVILPDHPPEDTEELRDWCRSPK